MIDDGTPVLDLPLSARLRKLLISHGIRTVAQARPADDAELLLRAGFGLQSIAELRAVVGYGDPKHHPTDKKLAARARLLAEKTRLLQRIKDIDKKLAQRKLY